MQTTDDKSKRVALYARVSIFNGQSPEVQLRESRDYCQRRGWEFAREYVDRGISGSKEHRPQLDQLLGDCRKRLVDAVVVYRYDRFARSLRQLVNALEEFRSLGVDFISLHEGVDTSTPNGRLVFGIFASIAEFERELIRGRVQLWKVHAQGGDAVELNINGGIAPQESADGNFLFFHRNDMIWKSDLDGANQTSLMGLNLLSFQNWKVCGRDICLLDDSSGPSGHFIRYDPVTKSKWTIPLDVGAHADISHGMDVSPDGKWVIYSRVDSIQDDIMLVENFH